jgi:hypothetical protein
VKISTLYLNHPGIALGYRLEHEGKVFCFISDNEPHSYSEGNGAGAYLLEEIRNGEVKLGPMDEALIDFIASSSSRHLSLTCEPSTINHQSTI